MSFLWRSPNEKDDLRYVSRRVRYGGFPKGQLREISVAGNDCKKGEVYARIEFINPQRVVTALFPVEGGKAVSCKTSAAVDKDLIFEIIKEIKSREAVKPVKIGDVLIENVLNTGADVVATSNMI